MTTIHEQIVQAYNNYVAEAETFEDKSVKAAAARARKALGDLGKLTKERRKEIPRKEKTQCNEWTTALVKIMGLTVGMSIGINDDDKPEFPPHPKRM